MYFILLARDKMYLSLKAIFAKQLDLDQFLGRLNGMVRSYVAGNLIIGALMSAITVLVFWQIGLAPAAILGVISGLLNLIPFLGMLMALGIPMMAGLFQFHTAGPFVVIGVTVVALHLLVANLLIPRFVGSRLDIGPVAATIGLLFWGWLWGIPGLLLAVPLTAFVKLLADTQPSLAQLSSLLARDPHKFLLRRARKPAAEGSAARPNAPQPSPSADVL